MCSTGRGGSRKGGGKKIQAVSLQLFKTAILKQELESPFLSFFHISTRFSHREAPLPPDRELQLFAYFVILGLVSSLKVWGKKNTAWKLSTSAAQVIYAHVSLKLMLIKLDRENCICGLVLTYQMFRRWLKPKTASALPPLQSQVSLRITITLAAEEDSSNEGWRVWKDWDAPYVLAEPGSSRFHGNR